MSAVYFAVLALSSTKGTTSAITTSVRCFIPSKRCDCSLILQKLRWWAHAHFLAPLQRMREVTPYFKGPNVNPISLPKKPRIATHAQSSIAEMTIHCCGWSWGLNLAFLVSTEKCHETRLFTHPDSRWKRPQQIFEVDRTNLFALRLGPRSRCDSAAPL